ncbi:hypothetical protein PM082_019595 [Marasmius tenuissimus]|nr:hypothetical protein PM082_019595 [Marasmius tenuissimus]
MSASPLTPEQEASVAGPLTNADIRLISLTIDLPAEERKEYFRIIELLLDPLVDSRRLGPDHLRCFGCNRRVTLTLNKDDDRRFRLENWKWHKKNCLVQLMSHMDRGGRVVPPPEFVDPSVHDAIFEARERALKKGLYSPKFIEICRQTGLSNPKDLNSPVCPPTCEDRGPHSRKDRHVHRFSPYGKKPEGGVAIPLSAITSRGAGKGAFSMLVQVVDRVNNQSGQPTRDTPEQRRTIQQINYGRMMPAVMQPQPPGYMVHQPPPMNFASVAQNTAMELAPQHQYSRVFIPHQQYTGQQRVTVVGEHSTGLITIPLQSNMRVAVQQVHPVSNGNIAPQLYHQSENLVPIQPTSTFMPHQPLSQAQASFTGQPRAMSMNSNVSVQHHSQVFSYPVHAQQNLQQQILSAHRSQGQEVSTMVDSAGVDVGGAG